MEQKFKIHEQGGYFLIICPNCNAFIKGTSELHVLANIKIHQESRGCEEQARMARMLGGVTGGGNQLPILRGNYEQKLKQLDVYKGDWFYEEMLEDLEKENKK